MCIVQSGFLSVPSNVIVASYFQMLFALSLLIVGCLLVAYCLLLFVILVIVVVLVVVCLFVCLFVRLFVVCLLLFVG